MTVIETIETLSDLEHSRWAHWQRYMFSKCIQNDDGSLTIPKELVERWQRQIDTPYSELSEKEKQSDREQVYPFIEIIDKYLSEKTTPP